MFSFFELNTQPISGKCTPINPNCVKANWEQEKKKVQMILKVDSFYTWSKDEFLAHKSTIILYKRAYPISNKPEINDTSEFYLHQGLACRNQCCENSIPNILINGTNLA